MRYHEGTPMMDHFNAFQGLANKCFDMDIKFDDEIHGMWLLGTLPDSWEISRCVFVTPLGKCYFDGFSEEQCF